LVKPEERPKPQQQKFDTRPPVAVGITEAQLHERSAELLNIVSVLTEATETAFEKQQSEVRRPKPEARLSTLVSNIIARPLPPSRSGERSAICRTLCRQRIAA